jgi:NTP pyrophosphatase (non-canonical NTP hydrolase)
MATLKDLTLSLSLEVHEILEHFQWKNEKDIRKHVLNNKEEIGHEIADVLSYLLMLSHDLDIDIEKAFLNKLKKVNEKYPVGEIKGKHTNKYGK